MSATPINRKYKVADANALEFAKTLRNSFITDQADFVAEDSNYANPFEVDWETAIDAAEAQPTDEQRKDQLMQLTEAVEVEMDLCRDTFQRAKRLIQKAFPDSEAHWNEFGFDDYEEARQSQPRMVPFMKRMHSSCLKYAPILSAPGINFNAARIGEIEIRRAALDAANDAQEAFKKDMPVFTRDRVLIYNALWDICTDVAGTGKLIYRNDAAQYQRYLLPASDEPAGTLILSGTVSAVSIPSTSGASAIEGALVELLPQGLESTTDSNGKFGFGTATAGPAMLRISHPAYMEQNIPVVIDPENPQTINITMSPLAPPLPPPPGPPGPVPTPGNS
jgi:hypothetical protein